MNKDYVVVKCGGAAVDSLSAEFYEQMKQRFTSGKKPVIVHGGGSAVNEMLELMDVTSTFVNGLRQTTPEVLEVADMVFNGKINPLICSQLQKAGLKSIGLSGCDGPMIQAELLDEKKLGLVGKAVDIDVSLLHELTAQGLTPVISPIVSSTEGSRLNMNADTAAAHYATALEAEEIMFVTNVPGVLKDGELVETATKLEIDKWIADGTIYGGMIPKVEAAVQALTGPVKKVTIIGGAGEAASQGGTTIVKSLAMSG